MPRLKLNPRKEYAVTNRLRRGYERKLEGRLQLLFRNTFREVAKAYELGNVEAGVAPFATNLSRVLVPHYTEVVTTFAKKVLTDRGLKFDFDNLSQQFITEHGGRSIRNIDSYTRRLVQKIISRGQRDGLGEREIAKSLVDMGAGFSKRRAATIARTETGNASSWANHQMHKEFMPANTKKRWVASSDDRTRSAHAVMNGVEVGIDETFTVGGFQMRYPNDWRGGAGNVINCRCVLMYIEPEDEVESVLPTDAPDTPVDSYSEQPWMYREGVKPKFDIDHDAFGLPKNMRNSDYIPEQETIEFRNAQRTALYSGLGFMQTSLIYRYTTGSYRQINNKFREWYDNADNLDKTEKSAALGHHAMMKTALNVLPAYKGTVARGVSDRVERMVQDYGIEVGSVIRSEAYWSTSYDPTKKFDKRLVFVINSVTGRKIDEYSQFPHETEVLFVAGTEFKITKVDDRTDRGGKYYVYMDEINSELTKSDLLDEMALFVRRMERSQDYVDSRFQDKLDDQSDLFSVDNRLITKL